MSKFWVAAVALVVTLAAAAFADVLGWPWAVVPFTFAAGFVAGVACVLLVAAWITPSPARGPDRPAEAPQTHPGLRGAETPSA